MFGVKVRVVTFAICATIAVGAALHGCGGQLPTPGGRAGSGGSGPSTGQAGTMGRGGVGGSGRGGMGPSGRGGASASVGTGGTAFGEPACVSTVVKGGACAPADQQFCYKTCGPEKTGVKSETCSGGVYAEMSGCSFDVTRDYSCYAIPSTANLACPQNAIIQASTPCGVDRCVLCNDISGLPG